MVTSALSGIRNGHVDADGQFLNVRESDKTPDDPGVTSTWTRASTLGVPLPHGRVPGPLARSDWMVNALAILRWLLSFYRPIWGGRCMDQYWTDDGRSYDAYNAGGELRRGRVG